MAGGEGGAGLNKGGEDWPAGTFSIMCLVVFCGGLPPATLGGAVLLLLAVNVAASRSRSTCTSWYAYAAMAGSVRGGRGGGWGHLKWGQKHEQCQTVQLCAIHANRHECKKVLRNNPGIKCIRGLTATSPHRASVLRWDWDVSHLLEGYTIEYSNRCHAKGNQEECCRTRVQPGIQWTTGYHCAQGASGCIKKGPRVHR